MEIRVPAKMEDFAGKASIEQEPEKHGSVLRKSENASAGACGQLRRRVIKENSK